MGCILLKNHTIFWGGGTIIVFIFSNSFLIQVVFPDSCCGAGHHHSKWMFKFKSVWCSIYTVLDIILNIRHIILDIGDIIYPIWDIIFDLRDIIYPIWDIIYPIWDIRDIIYPIWDIIYPIWDIIFDIGDIIYPIWDIRDIIYPIWDIISTLETSFILFETSFILFETSFTPLFETSETSFIWFVEPRLGLCISLCFCNPCGHL